MLVGCMLSVFCLAVLANVNGSAAESECSSGYEVDEVSALQVASVVNVTSPASRSEIHAHMPAQARLDKETGASLNTPLCSNGRACPHIVLILADDLGWYDVPWHNEDMAAYLPTLSGLAGEGVVLDRQYGFYACAPSRASLFTGRLPFHATSQTIDSMQDLNFGPSADFTFFSSKLKEVGYATHVVGKWHLGTSTPALLPQARGFDSWFGFFSGGEDHWTQEPFQPFLDLWIQNSSFSGPAKDYLGNFNDAMFANRIVQILAEHDVSQPAFLYASFQNPHEPLQVPDEYLDVFPETWTEDYRTYAAMVRYLDFAILNLTSALKNRGMWENTLLIFSADNGADTAGCNYPLLGRKTFPFEGGVRLPAFVSGGFLPAAVRGSTQKGLMHLTDWYATLCDIVGASSFDSSAWKAGLPAVDSLSMWPLITGQATESPRDEIVISMGIDQEALIVGRYKLVIGLFTGLPQWTNNKNVPNPEVEDLAVDVLVADCTEGCLYDILADPTESFEISLKNPEVKDRLMRRMSELRPETLLDPEMIDSAAMPYWTEVYDSFVGPWLF